MKSFCKNQILRIIALLIVALISANAAFPVFAVETNPFSDINEDDWYYKSVIWAHNEGVTSGVGNNHFKPHGTLTYAEICTFLYRFAYSPTPHYTYSSKLSKYKNNYYYKAINWTCDFGIIKTSDITEGKTPKNTLTRNEYVKILYQYSQNWEHRSTSVSNDRLSAYTDVPNNEEDQTAWNWAIDRGIISGTSNSTLSPYQKLTRAQFVTMLYRYNEYQVNRKKSPLLKSEILLGKRLRGWQRAIFEAGEKCLGCVTWVDEAYELGNNGLPIRIDCSGFVNWLFTYTGICVYDDLCCWDLWNSNVFSKILEKNTAENGYSFIKRVQQNLQPGDMLLSRNQYGNHIMVYIGSTASEVYVIQCRSGKGVAVESLSLSANSYYIVPIYGVLRYIP